MLQQSSNLFACTNTLIILDDCAMSKEMKKRSNKLIELAFSGRHKGLSVWVFTQLTSIAKPFRDNVACVVAFYSSTKTGMQILFEEYGSDLYEETRKKFVQIMKEERYSRLFFSLRYPFTCYVEIPSPSQTLLT